MEAKYTVFTIRGRTGMVAGLELLSWETESEMAYAVQECIIPKWRGQVRHISYDDPSRVVLLAMRDMCPGLKVFNKDPLHLYINSIDDIRVRRVVCTLIAESSSSFA